MRISKIFKRNDQADIPLPKGIKPEENLVQESSPAEPGVPHHHETSVRISSALNQELEKERPSTPGMAHFYDDILKKAKDVYIADPSMRINFASEIQPLVEKVIESLRAGDDELLLICLRDYQRPEDLLYCHIANVVTISIAVGIYLGYENEKLIELGVAAFVHDIGEKGLDILHKTDMFSDEDFDKVRKHPEEGALALSVIDTKLNQRIVDAVKQEHERIDGSGYPEGLVADEIAEYAQIIGLADVYEALMHDRPYRSKYTSIDAIRIILKNKKTFSRKVVKALIEVFGIFPVETLVQLNTKEIAIVVKRNTEFISRPILDILIDSYGKEVKQHKRINLAENPVVYIDTCVKKEIAKADA